MTEFREGLYRIVLHSKISTMEREGWELVNRDDGLNALHGTYHHKFSVLMKLTKIRKRERAA